MSAQWGEDREDYDRRFGWGTPYRMPKKKQNVPKGMIMDTDRDVYHTMKATLGLRAVRDSKGAIKSVTCTKAWKDRPEHMDADLRLMRVEIEVPESFFGFESLARGKIESRLAEEFTALVEELKDE